MTNYKGLDHIEGLAQLLEIPNPIATWITYNYEGNNPGDRHYEVTPRYAGKGSYRQSIINALIMPERLTTRYRDNPLLSFAMYPEGMRFNYQKSALALTLLKKAETLVEDFFQGGNQAGILIPGIEDERVTELGLTPDYIARLCTPEIGIKERTIRAIANDAGIPNLLDNLGISGSTKAIIYAQKLNVQLDRESQIAVIPADITTGYNPEKRQRRRLLLDVLLNNFSASLLGINLNDNDISADGEYVPNNYEVDITTRDLFADPLKFSYVTPDTAIMAGLHTYSVNRGQYMGGNN